MLTEIYQRYRRPLLVAETGAENRLRAGWFRYVCHEVHAAIAEGIPVLGICLYPIVNHPGWVDCRHCHNALWDYPDESGHRKIYEPLAREIRKEHKLFRQSERVALEQGTAEPELLMHCTMTGLLAHPRPEYPRPERRRGMLEGVDWLNLNGPWQFRFDPSPRRPAGELAVA